MSAAMRQEFSLKKTFFFNQVTFMGTWWDTGRCSGHLHRPGQWGGRQPQGSLGAPRPHITPGGWGSAQRMLSAPPPASGALPLPLAFRSLVSAPGRPTCPRPRIYPKPAPELKRFPTSSAVSADSEGLGTSEIPISVPALVCSPASGVSLPFGEVPAPKLVSVRPRAHGGDHGMLAHPRQGNPGRPPPPSWSRPPG